MKRIFYFSNFQLTIFHWQRKKCIARYTFNSSQQGLEKFKTYLLETNNAPVRILLDLIEEDFKQKSTCKCYRQKINYISFAKATT